VTVKGAVFQNLLSLRQLAKGVIEVTCPRFLYHTKLEILCR
jgi:hypothetical protein